jgi:HAE1 family hydrophobic/amphiphilic exporter-1
VDDAIVMLENIVRHVEMGEGVMEAAFKGSKEIGFTILSMTLSLTAVFIPILFMGGIVGRLFHEFAVTISVAILVSGFVSLSLTPMLSSRFLRPDHGRKHGRLYEVSERYFDRMVGVYDRGLTWALARRRTTMAVSALVLVATVFLFLKIPKGFLPSEDNSQIFGFTEAAQGISFRAMGEHQMAVAKVVQQDPNILAFMSSYGSRGSINASNSGVVFIHLKPR